MAAAVVDPAGILVYFDKIDDTQRPALGMPSPCGHRLLSSGVPLRTPTDRKHGIDELVN